MMEQLMNTWPLLLSLTLISIIFATIINIAAGLNLKAMKKMTAEAKAAPPSEAEFCDYAASLNLRSGAITKSIYEHCNRYEWKFAPGEDWRSTMLEAAKILESEEVENENGK